MLHTASPDRTTTHLPRTPHVRRLRLPGTADEVFAAATVVLTVVAVALAAVGRVEIGGVVALLAVGLGAWSQLNSKTRFERFESVIAVVVAAVTLAVCLAGGSGIGT